MSFYLEKKQSSLDRKVYTKANGWSIGARKIFRRTLLIDLNPNENRPNVIQFDFVQISIRRVSNPAWFYSNKALSPDDEQVNLLALPSSLLPLELIGSEWVDWLVHWGRSILGHPFEFRLCMKRDRWKAMERKEKNVILDCVKLSQNGRHLTKRNSGLLIVRTKNKHNCRISNVDANSRSGNNNWITVQLPHPRMLLTCMHKCIFNGSGFVENSKVVTARATSYQTSQWTRQAEDGMYWPENIQILSTNYL